MQHQDPNVRTIEQICAEAIRLFGADWEQIGVYVRARLDAIPAYERLQLEADVASFVAIETHDADRQDL